MPRTGLNAVCLTECPWSSLLRHTQEYSPYGIGFSNPFVFSRHGAPALYVRWDVYNRQDWDPRVKALVTPFWPAYRPKNLRLNYKTCDYAHEREGRVHHALAFDYDNVEFIILNNYEDMAKFPKTLKDAIGRDKFILMDNYRTIEKLWPVHIMGDGEKLCDEQDESGNQE